MSESHDDSAKSKPRVANPLWIISLFLGISEVTSGAVALKSQAWIQAVFTLFSVGFPCAVLVLFFIVLWKKPYVLYAPRDYSDDVDVEVFVKAMGENVRRGVEVAQTAAASSAEAVANEFHLDTGDTEMLVRKAKDAAEESVRLSVATVDLSSFLTRGSTLKFIVSESSTVNELLDAIYVSISAHVAPYTYGNSWQIKLKDAKNPLVDIGTNWAMNNEYGNSDTRLLGEVGIAGGGEIEVIDLRRSGV